MRRLIVVLFACILSCLPLTALAEENLLANPNFEEGIDGQPVGWTAEMWLYDPGVSYLELHEGGYDGGWCVMVENVARNDARFVQTVKVVPDTVYRLSGWVKAEDCPVDNAGASLSILETYAAFPEVHDTQGEWVQLECWVRTAQTHESLKIGVRLGDYSADNTGKAYFDALSFARDDNPPADAYILPLMDYTSTNWLASETVETEGTLVDIGSMLPYLIGFGIALLALWVLRARGIALPAAAIWAVLLLAAALRLYLMVAQPGYPTDMNCFLAWSQRMASVGPNAFYAPDYFCDYPPGYMYLLWLTGLVLRLFNITSFTPLGRVIVKMVPVLADLGAVYLIWRLARKRLGNTPALMLAALYAVSPAILVDGAMWGQVDAVLALGLLATVALALRGNWRAALPVFTVTVLMKPQALLAAPVGVIALVMDMLPLKENGRKTALNALAGLGISLAVAATMLLPFLWGKEAPVAWIIDKYATTLGSYAYATLNAANVFYLIGANWTPLETMLGPLSYGTWGTLLMVVVVLGTMALYVVRRDRKLLPFFCAMIYMGLYLFGVKMHERYLFPVFLLLLYAYALRPDWRLLALFGGFSVTFFINCFLVLRDTHLALGFGFAGVALAVVNLALYGLGLWMAFDRKTRPLPAPRPPADAPAPSRLAALEGRSKPFPRMHPKDWIAMLSLTLVYAVIAYVGLGSTVAPQTPWISTGAAETVVFDLGESREFHTLYYAGINSRDITFTLSFSEDGEYWMDETPQKVTPGACFRWQYATVPEYSDSGEITKWSDDPVISGGRYVRMSVTGPALTLMEITFRDLQGNVLPVVEAQSYGAREESASDPMALVDEPETVPEQPSYFNSTYFDEIYHARTGYEHAHQMNTYETTHPPLGKIFIMWGIQLFGMTPFGWRFMGTLAGVLMIPAMYLMGKLLFKKARYAFLAAFVMAFDMMHLTQTRIATIDSYAVLFIILMYLCMFRYLQMSFFRDGWRTLVPLGLSGLFMGLGCASKWICFYAGAGLAVLFAWSMVRHFLDWRAGLAAGEESAQRVRGYPKYLIGTLGACLVFFILIPFAIYYLSYIPYFAYESGGLTWTRFWQAQTGMFSYHANLVDDHSFQSPWYEWPLMLKPMYYYDGKPFVGEGMVATIMCMGNPAVWWVGLAAFGYVIWRWLKPALRGERQTDHRLAMILLGFAAQFLPWVLVPRSTFIYHYFGSLPFVMLCIVYASEQLHLHRPQLAKTVSWVYMGVVVLLFIGFYPIATGMQIPRTWADAMNWLRFLRLPGWRFRGWLFY